VLVVHAREDIQIARGVAAALHGRQAMAGR
jgi:hypothetical protein